MEVICLIIMSNQHKNLQVVEVGGHKLLVGKPDKRTEHMASLVSRQLDNRSGYNVLTGKVLQDFGVAQNSAGENSLRKISKHLLRLFSLRSCSFVFLYLNSEF